MTEAMAWNSKSFRAVRAQQPLPPRAPLVVGVTAPPAARQAGVWPGLIPPEPGAGEPLPLWWWLGAHGGAGVSTLTAMFTPSGDSRRWWPSGSPDQSCSVVLVARTHRAGLDRARDLITQYTARQVPAQLRMLGLVTIPDAPGRLPKQLRRHRDLVAAGAPHAWHLPWVEEWRTATTHELPIWHPARADGNGQGQGPVLPPAYVQMVADLMRLASIHQQF